MTMVHRWTSPLLLKTTDQPAHQSLALQPPVARARAGLPQEAWPFPFPPFGKESLMKRFRWLLMLALIMVPLAGVSVGCEGEVDDDGASLDVGD